MPKTSSPFSKQKLFLWLGRLGAGTALVFFCLAFSRNFKDIPLQFHGWDSLRTLGFALCLNLFVYWNTSLIWFLLLKQPSGGNITKRESVVIIGISQMAKYLPGNIFQLVGRVVMTCQAGVERGKAIYCLLAESLLAVALCLSLSLIGLAWQGQLSTYARVMQQTGIHSTSFLISALVLGILGLLGTACGFYFRHFIRTQYALLRSYLTGQAAFWTLFLNLITAITYGVISLLMLKHFFPSADKLSLLTHTIGFALAWTAGFITPGSPAGLGIRELIFTLLYGPFIGYPASIGLAVALRLCNTLAEGIFFVLAVFLKKTTQ